MDKNQLIENIAHGDAAVAMEAAKAIIAQRSKISVPRIEKIAGDAKQKDWSRIAAIYLLGNLISKKSAPILAEILQNEEEKPIFREYAAEALGNIGDPAFLPMISAIARKTHSAEVRRSCEFALAEIPAIEARRARSGQTRSCGGSWGKET